MLHKTEQLVVFLIAVSADSKTNHCTYGTIHTAGAKRGLKHTSAYFFSLSYFSSLEWRLPHENYSHLLRVMTIGIWLKTALDKWVSYFLWIYQEMNKNKIQMYFETIPRCLFFPRVKGFKSVLAWWVPIVLSRFELSSFCSFRFSLDVLRIAVNAKYWLIALYPKNIL